MATGDITSITVRADGWTADVVVSGFTTGATYTYGNRYLGTGKVALTCTSPGYDNTGTPNTSTRTVYGTLTCRKAYNSQATLDETGGGNLSFRMALDAHIWSGDTSITANVTAGLVKNDGGAGQTSLVATGLSVTNNSTLGYPKTLGRWTTIPMQRIGTSTFTLGAVCVHQSGKNNTPVACVAFTVSDGIKPNQTVIATQMTKVLDASGIYHSEYQATFNGSDFTAATKLTCNFKAYPWIGDTSTPIDTSTAGGAWPPTNTTPGPIILLNDYTNTFGQTVCYVDPTSKITTASTLTGLYQLDTIPTASTLTGLTNGEFIGQGSLLSGVNIQFIAAGNQIVRASGSWITDGYGTGSVIITAGSAQSGNNGVFHVVSTTATTLTVKETLTDDASASGRRVLLTLSTAVVTSWTTGVVIVNSITGAPSAGGNWFAPVSNVNFTPTSLPVQGELITQAQGLGASNATAIVNWWTAGNVYVTDIKNTPDNTNVWTGALSGVSFTPTSLAVAQGNNSDASRAQDISNDATAKAHPAATMGGAVSGIKGYNNTNHTRNNIDCGIIYLLRGRHQTTHLDNADSLTGATYFFTITRASGLNPDDARISLEATGSTDYGSYNLRLYDVEFRPDATGTFLVNCVGTTALVIFDHFRANYIVGHGTNGVVQSKYQYSYNSIYINTDTPAGQNQTEIGCTYYLVPNPSLGTSSFGNVADNINAASARCFSLGDYAMVGWNKFTKFTTTGSAASASVTSTIGSAMFGNLIEAMGSSFGALLWADGVTNANTNLLVFNNTTTSNRENAEYNDVGGTSTDRSNGIRRFNLNVWCPIKCDIFATNAANIGDWSRVNGVGNEGNINYVTFTQGTNPNYVAEWHGWKSLPYWYGITGLPAPTTKGFVNDQSGTGANSLTVLGDYRITSSAPARNMIPSGLAMIPFDFLGAPVANDGTGSAGALQTPLPTVTFNSMTANLSSIILNVDYISASTVIDVTTITGSNILVTGPGGYSQTMAVDNISPGTNASDENVNYTISSNLPTKAGVYTATLQSNQVKDVDGNPVTSIVVGTASLAIPITSPNGGESWKVGSIHNITWTAGTTTSGNVKIELSRNSGGTWTTLFASVADNGTQAWTVTSPTGSVVDMIRISDASDATITGMSSAPFSITAQTNTGKNYGEMSIGIMISI
jgi:hypothetical protein